MDNYYLLIKLEENQYWTENQILEREQQFYNIFNEILLPHFGHMRNFINDFFMFNQILLMGNKNQLSEISHLQH